MYAVLFDIDGTLIQTGGAGQLAFAKAFATEFGVEQMSDKISFSGRSDRAIAQDLMEAHSIDPSDESWRRFQSSYLEHLPHMLQRSDGKVLPGVQALISALKERDYVVVGLLTGNVQRGADTKLAHYGLHKEFSFGGFGDEATDRNRIAEIAKQEAEHFVRRHFSTSTEKGLRGAMAIGDTVHDVRCAKSIDAHSVAVCTGGGTKSELQQETPDVLINTLEDIDPILEIVDRAAA